MSKLIATGVPSRRLTHPVFRCISAVCTLTALSLILSACATVTVKKVPTPTQYLEWTDAKQAEADAMEGIRFYLPRPYVNVFESFPISTDIYFAEGTLSVDGKYVHVDEIYSIGEDGTSIKSIAKFPAAVPTAQLVYAPKVEAHSGGDKDKVSLDEAAKIFAQSGGIPSIDAEKLKDIAKLIDAVDGPLRKPLEEFIKGLAKSAGEEAGKEAGKKLLGGVSNMFPNKAKKAEEAGAKEPTSGLNTRSMTNDPSAYSYQPLRGNFDLVYLPDLEEQYVAGSKSRLGKANMKIKLGQGWSLQGFDSVADNSELTKRIYSFIDAAQAAATNAIFPGAGAASKVLAQSGAPKSLDEMLKTEKGREAASKGIKVTLRIAVLHYAAKGLYPVLKPREIAGGTVSNNDETLNANIAAPGRPVWDKCPMPCDPIDGLNVEHTLPKYPYQVVSFNTFKYLYIEAITPELGPETGLYDKTGTKGDPGDRRESDPVAPGNTSSSNSEPAEDQPAEDPLRPKLNALGSKVLEKAKLDASLGSCVQGVLVGVKAENRKYQLIVATNCNGRDEEIKTLIEAIVKKLLAEENEFESLRNSEFDIKPTMT